MKKSFTLFCIIFLWSAGLSWCQSPSRILVLSEDGGHHLAYTDRAKTWLNDFASKHNYQITYLKTTDPINEEFLAGYSLFIQLDYPPYRWSDVSKKAFENYIEQGKGGWIGFHHATLLGEFDGFKLWNWFSDFMGGILYKNYIASFVSANVVVEAGSHPVFKGIPGNFVIQKEEWYTYDKSPRPRVRVLASVDESSYQPESRIKMGDHPVIWTNEKHKARNIYIFMGHSPDLFDNKAYTQLFSNAIFWASGK